MPTVIREHEIDDNVRSLSTFKSFDYVDFFTATTSEGSGKPPEYWVRALVQDAAGRAGQFVWRVILGLRLAWQRSPEHVGGWEIASRGESWITLEAASWFLSANIVLCVEAELLSVATIIRYDRPIAALIWPPVSIFHRQAMPGLLRQALSPAKSEG